MIDVEIARATQRERLASVETAEGRFRREFFAYQEMDRLKERLSEVRQSLRVAQAR